MGKHENPTLPLYERDFHAWSQEQAEKLRARAHDDIDWENVAEEIDSLGRSDRREISHRLGVLLLHLLKWHLQPPKRKPGWLSTIREQRHRIAGLIEESPSLKAYPGRQVRREYGFARQKAIDETGLPESEFPVSCPYTIANALDDAYFPGEPWSPEQLARD
jgi:predicted YcjX-like family ATPase